MNYFIGAIKQYADFKGRARRKEYWMFILFYMIIQAVINIIDSSVIGSPILSPIFSLALLIPSIAIAVRRLHDTGRSGWWLLLGLIPFGIIVVIIFLFLDSHDDNEYGPNPKAATA